MTTDTDRVTMITGDLINLFLDAVPDEQVVDKAKAYVHAVLDNGYHEPMNATELKVWELASLLGFVPITDPWKIESAIRQLLDQYDLFNG